MVMRRHVVFTMMVVAVASCSGGEGSTDSIATNPPPFTTTTNPSPTTAPTTEATTTTFPLTTTSTTTEAVATTLTYTGSDCIQSGPDTFPSGEIVRITFDNESSVDMAVVVLELVDVTLDELVADDVRLFPPITSWPPPGAQPKEAHSTRKVDSDSEVKHSVAFHQAGNYGTVCWPLDGSPAIQGALLTVED